MLSTLYLPARPGCDDSLATRLDFRSSASAFSNMTVHRTGGAGPVAGRKPVDHFRVLLLGANHSPFQYDRGEGGHAAVEPPNDTHQSNHPAGLVDGHVKARVDRDVFFQLPPSRGLAELVEERLYLAHRRRGHCLGGELNRERLELAADRVHLLCVLSAELDDRVPAGLIAHHETIAFQEPKRIPDRDATRPDFLRQRSLNEPRTAGDLSTQYPVAQQMIDLGAECLPSHSHFLLIAQ